MTAESTAPPTPPEAPPRAQVRRLHRSRTNRVLAGVCGGIAEYYGSDPTAVRLAALIIGLFTGVVPMVLAYIIAAIVVPDGDGVAMAGERPAVAPGQTAMVLGALLILIGIAGFANVWLHVDWDRVWPFALIGLGAVLVVATLRPRSRIRPLTRAVVRRTLRPPVAVVIGSTARRTARWRRSPPPTQGAIRHVPGWRTASHPDPDPRPVMGRRWTTGSQRWR